MVQEPDLVGAEKALGVTLPQDYRDFLKASDGLAESMPDAYVELWSISDVVDVNVSNA